METKQKRDSLFICLLLVVATLIVYFPVTHFEFVNYDDPHYVSDNPQIKQGFSAKSIAWAFTTAHCSNWHPVTWLSHMLDWTLFGSNAGGHHLTNVLFHIGSTLVLFFALRLLTGAIWRSGLVAALFALHPLHVESVAWVSERKDVLSAFFGMLTVLFYARYVKDRSAFEGRITSGATWNYVSALLCLSVGLLAKQMLVTLPFCLLLLDVWPLNRILTYDFKSLFRLALEKVPFFVVAGVFIPIAVWAQNAGHSIVSIARIPLDQRLENVVISYFRYFGKMLWPSKLTVFYPYPSLWPISLFAVAAVFLLAGFAIAILQFKRRPFIAVGWCWFIGTLVPVIGIMQIGSQSLADRYFYIPSIGLFVVFVWLIPRIPKLGAVLACVIIGTLSIVSGKQLQYWRSSITLFEHGIAVSEANTTMHLNLGAALLDQGKTNAAMENFKAALEINPNESYAHANLARIYVDRGNWDEAALHYEAALELSPRDQVLELLVGSAFEKQNRPEEALKHYERALEIAPDYSKAAFAMGTVLATGKKFDRAVVAYQRGLEMDPKDASGHVNLGIALISLNRLQEAEAHLREAIRLHPEMPEAQHNLAMVLLARQKTSKSGSELDEAVMHLKEAIRLNKTNALAHVQLAGIASQKHDTANAIIEYREALKITPDSPETLNNLAWVLASSGNANLRNGEEAVRLAEKACNLVGYKVPIYIGTLAAAYAEAGNFEKAVEMGEAAYQIATSAGQTETAEKNLELLMLYRAGHPYWEAPPAATNR